MGEDTINLIASSHNIKVPALQANTHASLRTLSCSRTLLSQLNLVF